MSNIRTIAQLDAMEARHQAAANEAEVEQKFRANMPVRPRLQLESY